jgi:hypothetical protein
MLVVVLGLVQVMRRSRTGDSRLALTVDDGCIHRSKETLGSKRYEKN